MGSTKACFGKKFRNLQSSCAALLSIAAAFENNVHTTTPRTIAAIPHHRSKLVFISRLGRSQYINNYNTQYENNIIYNVGDRIIYFVLLFS